MSADAEYIRVLRAMTPEQKLRAAEELYDSTRELKAAVLRQDHPDWTEKQIQHAVSEWPECKKLAGSSFLLAS